MKGSPSRGSPSLNLAIFLLSLMGLVTSPYVVGILYAGKSS